MNTRVLLIEDDRNLAESILHYLELNELVCDFCEDGNQGLNLIANNAYDVIVSDVNMPKLDGFSMCQRARKEGNATPILLLTANSELNDKLQGFESGADDYLTKPFAMQELLARITALAKRSSGNAKVLKIANLGLEVNLDERWAKREGVTLQLSPSSWVILELLARAYPKAVSKSDLEFAVWGDQLPDSNALKVHVHRLRQRLDKPFSCAIVQVVAGFGFQLKKSDEQL